MKTPDAATRPPWLSLGSILLPWVTLAYAWWVGIHWTLIGLGAINGVAMLIALGSIIERIRLGKL